ncbi:MAG: MXAN_5187 C-terminal domain-containing protein, partial [Acidobacteriota bacterium]
RAREEGRPGPFAQPRPREIAKPEAPESRVLHVASFNDPTREVDKVRSLYDTLMEARRQVGEDVVPFHKFAALVRDQVSKLRENGSAEVAFRVAVTDGKVNFTVRGLKGGTG